MIRPAPLLLTIIILCGVARAQILITPNTGTDTVVAFNPVDGSLVTPNLFPIATTGGIKVSALEVNGEIWVSEQIGDRIVRHDAAGTVVGVIGPTFPGGGLDNPRGMTLINGLVHVANEGANNGAVADSITVFDPAGNFVTAYPLSSTLSPYSTIDFQGGLLVASSSANDDLHRYSYTGTSLGTFHNSTAVNFAHQVAHALDGNVWCATFSSNTLVKLDAATGSVLVSYPANSARGVFELFNGNLLWSSSAGVSVFDVTTQTSTLVLAGASAHFSLYSQGSPAAAQPYGTGCDGLVLGASGLPQLGNASFALQLSNVPAVSPVGLFGFGTQVVSPGLDLTAIGMGGCFAYTNLDLGLYAGSPVSSSISTVALPIPNDPSLNGAQLSSQGVAFSTTTALGLASSNGLQLILGQ